MASEQEARVAKNLHSAELLKTRGVSGVGVGKDAMGNYLVDIYLDTDDPAVQSALPNQLEGCPTRFVVSGPFRKLS